MIPFNEVFDRVIGHEGGYVNDPEDPGGETKWGISKRSYPHLDIESLTREDAREIYKRDFWDPVVANTGFDAALCFEIFDAAVNHGMGNATRLLQRAVGVADDGHWSRVSQGALNRMDMKDIHLLFMAERFEFWAKLQTFTRFGRGWVRRGAQNLRYIAMDN